MLCALHGCLSVCLAGRMDALQARTHRKHERTSERMNEDGRKEGGTKKVSGQTARSERGDKEFVSE